MLSIRPLNDTDYDEILIKWWSSWKWTPPTRDFLPDNGSGGLIVYDDDEPICAGFLYTTNSLCSWVDFIVSSPIYRKKPLRKEALSLLIYSLTEIAKETGHKYAYALIKHGSLIDTYLHEGYVLSGNYQTEMIKKLND